MKGAEIAMAQPGDFCPVITVYNRFDKKGISDESRFTPGEERQASVQCVAQSIDQKIAHLLWSFSFAFMSEKMQQFRKACCDPSHICFARIPTHVTPMTIALTFSRQFAMSAS
ncbi:hypothetical protein thsrh120_37990 [Rhizobium sp. No.120]